MGQALDEYVELYAELLDKGQKHINNTFFRAFICTATGYGTVGVQNGKPFCKVVSGEIPYEEIRYVP